MERVSEDIRRVWTELKLKADRKPVEKVVIDLEALTRDMHRQSTTQQEVSQEHATLIELLRSDIERLKLSDTVRTEKLKDFATAEDL